MKESLINKYAFQILLSGIVLFETIYTFLYSLGVGTRFFLFCMFSVFNFLYCKAILSNNQSQRDCFIFNIVISLMESMIYFLIIDYDKGNEFKIKLPIEIINLTAVLLFIAVLITLRFLLIKYLKRSMHKQVKYNLLNNLTFDEFVFFCLVFFFQVFFLTFGIKTINIFFICIILLFFLTNIYYFYYLVTKLIFFIPRKVQHKFFIRYSLYLFAAETILFSIYSSFIFGKLTRNLPFYVYIGGISYYVIPLLLVMLVRVLSIRVLSKKLQTYKRKASMNR